MIKHGSHKAPPPKGWKPKWSQRMRGQWRQKWGRRFSQALPDRRVSSLIPNMITLGSLCLGLSAIPLALAHQWRMAVASILLAGLLDGLDGRLARLLKVCSALGAELDSLADFINFGVAPGIVIYQFCLHQWGALGWWLCLFFAICMALRLARFNVQRQTGVSPLFSVGVPAPAGALLILSPLIALFALGWDTGGAAPTALAAKAFQASTALGGSTFSPVPAWLAAVMTLTTAVLLISRYPTFVFKTVVIPRQWMGMCLAVGLALIAGLVSAPWETLLVVVLVYLGSLGLSGYFYYRKGWR